MSKAGENWNKQQIEDVKRLVKADLDQFKGDPARRLRHCLEMIRRLEAATAGRARLQCVIYVISALVHHERHGGLKLNHVRHLADLAWALLQIQGVQTKSSHLAFLYGEVHAILGQIYRKAGDHWRAGWELQVARRASPRNAIGGPGFLDLSAGVRSMRLGNTHAALAAWRQALEAGIAGPLRDRCHLEMAKAFRLLGDFDAMDQILGLLGEGTAPGLAIRKEADWERTCAKVQNTGDLGPLITLVKRSGSHHEEAYVVEAFIWSRVVTSREGVKRFPTIKTIARDSQIKPNYQAPFVAFARQLERCYDKLVPIDVRVRNLGRALPLARQVLTIDQEILMWAAAGRWLARSHIFHLAAMVLAEYQALCLRISQGQNPDLLMQLTDLLKKDWADPLLSSMSDAS